MVGKNRKEQLFYIEWCGRPHKSMAIRQRPAGGEEASHSGEGECSRQWKGQWSGGWSRVSRGRGIGNEIQVGPGSWRGWLELQ